MEHGTLKKNEVKKKKKTIQSLQQANMQSKIRASESINIGKRTSLTRAHAHTHTLIPQWIGNIVKLCAAKRTELSQRRNVTKLGHSLKGGEKCLDINVCLQGMMRVLRSKCMNVYVPHSLFFNETS